MTDADLIWNRATLEDGGSDPSAGDRALVSLLRAHGLAMNGGVLHAVSCLETDELAAAPNGYRFFGLDEVAALLLRVRDVFVAGDDLESLESLIDGAYASLIPTDASLAEKFETRFRSHSADFAPQQ